MSARREAIVAVVAGIGCGLIVTGVIATFAWGPGPLTGAPVPLGALIFVSACYIARRWDQETE